MADTSPITRLNADVLREVFLYLSKYDLLDVTFVCKEWNAVAQGLIDQTLELVASKRMQAANICLLRRCQEDERLQRRVKHVVVKEWHLGELPPTPKTGYWVEDPWLPGNYFSTTYEDQNKPSTEAEQLLTSLSSALNVLRLSSFSWSAILSVPTSLLRQLARQRSCDVHIRRNERAYEWAVLTYAPICNHNLLRNLGEVGRQLASLELLLPPQDDAILEALGVLVSSAPRLKSLKLYALGRLWGGPHVPLALSTGRGSAFNRTTSMEWLQSPLSRANGILRLEELQLDNFCVCGLEGFDINSLTDISRLRKVGLSCFSFLANAGRLPALQSFRLHCHKPRGFDDQFCLRAWSATEVQQILSGCSRLVELELCEGLDVLSEPLLRLIGPNLRHMSLHQQAWPDTSLAYDLDLIRKTCTRLWSLDIDLPGNVLFTKFCSSLSSSYPRLSRLAIRRPEEQVVKIDHFTPDPAKYSTNCAEVYKTWQRTANGRSNLETLILRYGFSKPWDRDIHFRRTGRVYSNHQQLGCRAFIARSDLPVRMTSEQYVTVRCFDVEEANRAVKHQWQWMAGHFRGQNSWEERFDQMKLMAQNGRHLILRMTPNSEGTFTQERMVSM